jgi:hypothetical protein
MVGPVPGALTSPYDLTRSDLEELLDREAPFRSRQIWEALHRRAGMARRDPLPHGETTGRRCSRLAIDRERRHERPDPQTQGPSLGARLLTTAGPRSQQPQRH